MSKKAWVFMLRDSKNIVESRSAYFYEADFPCKEEDVNKMSLRSEAISRALELPNEKKDADEIEEASGTALAGADEINDHVVQGGDGEMKMRMVEQQLIINDKWTQDLFHNRDAHNGQARPLNVLRKSTTTD